MQNKNLPWGEYGYFLELHIGNNRKKIETLHNILYSLKEKEKRTWEPSQKGR